MFIAKRTLTVGVAVLMAAALALLIKNYSMDRGNAVQRSEGRTVEITYHFTIEDVPQQARHIRVWVPVPFTDDHQKFEQMQVVGGFPYKIVEDTEYGNRFLVFDIGDSVSIFAVEPEIVVKFRVTRYATDSLRKRYRVDDIDQANLARFLAPNRLIPIDGKIGEEARLVAGHIQNPLKQSRALYDHIVETLSYDKSGTGWGRGDAIYACDIRKGNCTDFHSLFIGQARALNIPARFIMGLPLPEDKNKGAIAGYHCWGEFYISGKGWLPIDASEAYKCPEKKELFFGGLDKNRVGFTVGRDIKLPGAAAGPLNYVIYPHVEIDGNQHPKVQTTFSFKDLPRQLIGFGTKR